MPVVYYKDRSFEAAVGENLLRVIQRAGLPLPADCGGRHHCGKCLVFAEGSLSPVSGEEKALLSMRDAPDNARLACFACVEGNCRFSLEKHHGAEVSLSFSRRISYPSPVTLFDAVLPEVFPDGKPVSEEKLLLSALASKGCAASVSSHALSGLARACACGIRSVTAAVCGGKVMSVSAKGAVRAAGLSVDIGTTTVAMNFYDLLSGKLLQSVGNMNPQKVYGADVISRIKSCIENPAALIAQRNAVIDFINGFISQFCRSFEYDSGDILRCVISGNPTMMHLFCGYAPNGIAVAPFRAATLFGQTITGLQSGLDVCPDADVILPDCVSAYVGADITAGLFSALEAEAPDTALYIDIGTNGEMALIKDGVIYCCSTAAGPAFEGAHITHGMPGVSGAVSSVEIGDSCLITKTVQDVPAAGICGSGLLDAVAVMLSLGVIDETGRLCDEDEIEEEWVLSLLDDDEFFIDKEHGISVTAADIRQVQLAKAAIAAGIDTLLHICRTSLDSIGVVWVAGGFGSYMRAESACRIGLIPSVLSDRIKVLGNCSLAGSSMLLFTDRKKTAELAAAAEYIELSGNNYFSQSYIDNMIFEE